MSKTLNVAELFAGVGGFRLGLEVASKGFVTKFSSQWEPEAAGRSAKQFASRCYVAHFGDEGHYNEDIAAVLTRVENGEVQLGEIDMVVGGFPCQDYSVAKPLNQADGLVGKKGVLWWQIRRLLTLLTRSTSGRTAAARMFAARWVLLENVDRLLTSPAHQKGRDFAIMLASLAELGYDVEWRVVNAADYGCAQRRRRVFILARRSAATKIDGTRVIMESGVLARAFEVAGLKDSPSARDERFTIEGTLDEISSTFGVGVSRTQFGNAGFVRAASSRKKIYEVWTRDVEPKREKGATLGDILLADDEIPDEFIVSKVAQPRWEVLKDRKDDPRVDKRTGFEYRYKEGKVEFPDPHDRPSRTILTSEGGPSPSRSKHVVKMSGDRLRRLHPVELERLNGFPRDWTLKVRDEDGKPMTAVQRAFCMGNALVVDLVTRIARVVAQEEGLS